MLVQDAPHNAAVSAAAPMLVPHKVAARMLGVSVPSWFRLVAAGKTPAPIRLGPATVRFRVDGLHEWVRLGCPDRKRFEAIQKAAGRPGSR
jgi:predicted DNA-binding transcriptional regulator AlpA